MRNLIKWFSRNNVAANFLMVSILAAGISTWVKLKKEIFPETSTSVVAVSVVVLVVALAAAVVTAVVVVA